MQWLKLTQANTGVIIYVNMAQVVVIAPNKTGGAALLTTADDKEAARIVPVKETPQEVAALMGNVINDGAPGRRGGPGA